jgi:putative Mg2+ transporter-C (MgtC) family protein
MDLPRTDILIHLLSALAAGAAIGMERTFHGRPAGFRTHALVCLASSLLMLVTVYQPRWFPLPASEAVRMDPTRMAQGIVTGIGFLGAGVIFKEGLTVRGLTTAASIWITSAIGILMGVGLYLPGVLATLLTLGVLTLFRRIETKVPVQFYAQHLVRFARASIMPEPELRLLLAGHGFKVAKLNYRLTDDGRYFEYRMVIRTSNEANATRLAETLGALEAVREFAISPSGD